jgi:hypothetical protein
MSLGEREIHVDGSHAATIHEGGVIVCAHTGQPVGSFVDGVLADDEGSVLGVLELAPGTACPDDFIAVELRLDPAGQAERIWNGPRDALVPTELPAAVPLWSSKDARAHIRGY